MRNWIALVLLLAAPARAGELETLAAWMTGSFSSAAQAEADEARHLQNLLRAVPEVPVSVELRSAALLDTYPDPDERARAVHTATVGYLRSLGLFGRSASLSASWPERFRGIFPAGSTLSCSV